MTGGPAGDDGPTVSIDVAGGGEAAPEELAAIIGAVEATWPRAPAETPVRQAPRWRFSGRWWSKPVPLRRSRPW